jgi:hypothetical protein
VQYDDLTLTLIAASNQSYYCLFFPGYYCPRISSLSIIANSPSAWTLHEEQSPFTSFAVNPMKHQASPNNDQPEKRTCPVYCKDNMFSSERSSTAIPHQHCHIHQITISSVPCYTKTPELVLRLHNNNRKTDDPIFFAFIRWPSYPTRVMRKHCDQFSTWYLLTKNQCKIPFKSSFSSTETYDPNLFRPIRTCFVGYYSCHTNSIATRCACTALRRCQLLTFILSSCSQEIVFHFINN